MESLPNIDFYLIETAMDYAQENKLDVFKVIETMSHFDEQDLTLWRFLDSKFKNAEGSADIPNNQFTHIKTASAPLKDLLHDIIKNCADKAIGDNDHEKNFI